MRLLSLIVRTPDEPSRSGQQFSRRVSFGEFSGTDGPGQERVLLNDCSVASPHVPEEAVARVEGAW